MAKVSYDILIRLEQMERKYGCGGQGYSYVNRIGMLKYHDLGEEEEKCLKEASEELRIDYEDIPEVEPPKVEGEEEK